MLLVADPGAAWSTDHADPGLRWAPPAGLVVGREPDGAPRFAVVRHGTGGFLHVELRADGPDPATVAKAAADEVALATVPFDRSRFRLVRWLSGVPGESEPAGPWHATTPGGAVLAAASVALDPVETQLLAAAVAHDEGAAVEVEAAYRGVVAGLPAVAVVDAALLRARLAALGDGPVRADAVVAVVRSLPTGSAVEIVGVEIVGEAEREAALERLGHRAVAELCEPGGDDPWAPARFRVRHGAPEGVRWTADLAPLTTRELRFVATWPVRDALAGLTPVQRDRVFPAVPPFSPFARTDLLVTCAVPVDGVAVRRVEAVLRGPGPGGVPESTTVAFTGDRTVAPVTLFRPLGTAADLTCRTLARLGPPTGDPDGPGRVVTTPARPLTGPLLDLTPAATGLVAARVAVAAGVFARAVTVEVALGATGAVLDADRPEVVLADPAPGDGPPPEVVAVAVEPGTGRRAEVLRRAAGGTVTVPAHAVEVLDPDPVTVTLDAATTAPWVALTVVDGAGHTRTRTLDPGVPVPWPCWRASVFDPLHHRHRVQHVPHPGGPLLTGAWTDATGPHLTITV